MAATLAWQADPADLAEFLRRRGLRVGVGEVLRALGVLERLAALGRAPATPREAARFLSPLLCSSLRHQEALPAWLEEFNRERSPTEWVAPARTVASAPRSRRTPWRIPLAIAAVALLPALLLALPNLPLGPDASAARGAALAAMLDGLTPLLDTVRRLLPPLLVVPMLVLAAAIWRGPRWPAMARGAYAGGPLARVGTGGFDAGGLFSAASLRDAIRGLRTHRRVLSRRIDPRATVGATLRRAGQPTLVRAQSVRAPEYPLLVHGVSSRDHLCFLAETLSAKLGAEGVHNVLYRFSSDPRLVWDGGGATVSLADLSARFGADVLVIVGDGAPLVDPVTHKLYGWTEELADWRCTVLLTPLPKSRWSWRERRLAEAGIVVLPATSEGIALLGGYIAGGGAPPRLPMQRAPQRPSLLTREGVHAHRFHGDGIPGPAESEAILDAILQDVPGAAIDVLAVAALFPETRPDLTLHLGQHLQLAGAAFGEEGFGALCTLPWLRYGRLPDWLRLALVRTLTPDLEAQGRRLLLAWVGTTPDPAGVTIASGADAASPGAPDEADLQDIIYLRLLRHEPLGTLELEAPGDLERLARARKRSWRIGIALSVVLADLLVGALIVSLVPSDAPRLDLPEWGIAVAMAAVAGAAVAGFCTLLSGSDRRARIWSAASLGLAAAAIVLLSPSWVTGSSEWTDLTIVMAFLLGPTLALLPRKVAASTTRPGPSPPNPAWYPLWLVLLTMLIAHLPRADTLEWTYALPVPTFLLALGGSAFAAPRSSPSAGRRLLVAAVGTLVAVQLTMLIAMALSALLPMVHLRFRFPLSFAVATPLCVVPLLCAHVAEMGRDGASIRRPLAAAAYSAVSGALIVYGLGTAWPSSIAVTAAGMAASAIIFAFLISKISGWRTLTIVVGAGIALLAVSLLPDAVRPLGLVAAILCLPLLRTPITPAAQAVFGMWFVTLDWYDGWIAPTGLGLVLQPLFLVAAVACALRFGRAGLPSVLLGGLPLLVYRDVPFWSLHCRGNVDLYVAGVLAFLAAASAERPVRWLARLVGHKLALASVSALTALCSVAVAVDLIGFDDLDGAIPAIFLLTQTGLTLVVAVTSMDLLRTLAVAVPGPAVLVLCIYALMPDVPDGPDWSILALVLAPAWLLLAGAMLAETLRRVAPRATLASTAVFAVEVLLVIGLVRAGLLTSGAMFAMLGALCVDQRRRSSPLTRPMGGGWIVPGPRDLVAPVAIGAAVAMLSGLRWEGAAALAVALAASQATRLPLGLAFATLGGDGFERLARLAHAILPSQLAQRGGRRPTGSDRHAP